MVLKTYGAVWVVNQNGTGDFLTIQQAINSSNVQSGDTIFIAPNVHFEQGIDNNSKSVTIMGSGSDVSLVMAPSGSGAPVFELLGGSVRIIGVALVGYLSATLCDTLTAESVDITATSLSSVTQCLKFRLSNSRVTGPITVSARQVGSICTINNSDLAGPVNITDMTAEIEGNVVRGVGGNGGALWMGGNYDGSVVTNNVIQDRNSSFGFESAIYLAANGANNLGITLTNNIIYRSPASNYNHYFINAGFNTAFIFNNIMRDGSICIANIGDLTTIAYNCSYNNSSCNLVGVGNIFANPGFLDFESSYPPDSLDFHLLPSSPCIDTGNPSSLYNDHDGTRNDMGVYGGPMPIGTIPVVVPPPNYPAVTALSLFPVIVPGNGTIEIRATGRIGPEQTGEGPAAPKVLPDPKSIHTTKQGKTELVKKQKQ